MNPLRSVTRLLEKFRPHSFPRIVILTATNLHSFPDYQKLLSDGKVRFDATGRLRYLHGAPVGNLFLARVKKDGSPLYQEAADEWFDPESQKARDFVWPK